ncbi:hypothetical protein QUC31_013125 [Theobroma cacao]
MWTSYKSGSYQFPDPSGLQATKDALASWQVVCIISRPTEGNFKCCVSFSAYYDESVIPCDTCACGCEDTEKCNPKKPAMLLPAEALLVPFANRSAKARAWAALKHFPVPKPLPCSDNCGVSINWHVTSDYNHGWAARITLFNWERINFENWFTVIQFKKAGSGYEKLYSFNGTLLTKLNNTIFIQGLPADTEENGIGMGISNWLASALVWLLNLQVSDQVLLLGCLSFGAKVIS